MSVEANKIYIYEIKTISHLADNSVVFTFPIWKMKYTKLQFYLQYYMDLKLGLSL
jgi:hypothetical protein